MKQNYLSIINFTWLLSSTQINNLYFKFIFLFFFLFKNFTFKFFFSSLSNFLNLYTYSFINKIKNNFIYKTLNVNFCNTLTKLVNYKKKNFFLNNSNAIKSNSFFTKNLNFLPIIINKNNKFFFLLFKIVHLLIQQSNKNTFNLNNNFNLFFSFQSKKTPIIDTNKLLIRWENSYNLLLNIFYYNFVPLIFSNIWHKNLTLSLNWFFNKWELRTWKFTYPFFIYKFINFNQQINYFYSQFKYKINNFVLLTDCSYHYHSLFFLKKNLFYSIGLISININPWLLTYPIFVFFDNFLMQTFFFKLIFFLYKQSKFINFFKNKNIWINAQLLKFFI